MHGAYWKTKKEKKTYVFLGHYAILICNHGDIEFKSDIVFAILEPIVYMLKNWEVWANIYTFYYNGAQPIVKSCHCELH